MTTDVFGSNDNLDNVDPIQYVTERYKNENGELDINKVARAVLEKDKHIKNVEGENGELRGEVKTRIGLEEFLTKMNNKPPEQVITPPGNQPQPNGNEAPVDIEKLVETHISTIERNRMAQANREKVNSKLAEIWGNDTQKNFDRVSSELGMPKSDLQALAERSPEAFFRVTGINRDAPPPAAGIPQGTTFVGTDGKAGIRNQSYYREMKKTNPNLYFSSKTQMQMHQDANTLKEKFFS